jgi:hypothetical protein
MMTMIKEMMALAAVIMTVMMMIMWKLVDTNIMSSILHIRSYKHARFVDERASKFRIKYLSFLHDRNILPLLICY